MRFVLLLGVFILSAGCVGDVGDAASDAELHTRRDFGYGIEPPPRDLGFKNPGPACVLMDLGGAADGFYSGATEVMYVKRFEYGGALEAQIVVTIPVGTTGTFNLLYPEDGDPDVLMLNPQESGVDVYRGTHGTMTIAGTPDFGEATLTFENLRLTQVDAATMEPVEDADCIQFYDFSLDGYQEVPAAWTCAPSAYNDAVCHCGCGAIDPACGGVSVRSCEACNADGACDEDGRGCGNIDSRDIGSCDFPLPPTPVTVSYTQPTRPTIYIR